MKHIGFLKALGISLWATGVLTIGVVQAQTVPVPTPVPQPTPDTPPAPVPGPGNPQPGTPQPGTPQPAPPRPGGPLPTPTPQQDPRGGDTPGAAVPQIAGKPVPTPTGTPTATPTPTGTPAPKTIEDLTKGFDKIDGFFTLYRKVENNRQRLMAEIKESQIGPLFILQTTFASGNASRITAGRPVSDIVWRWNRTPDDRLVVDVPNLWFRSDDPNLKIAVERDFPDAYLDVFPILAKSKERKTVLVDFGSFFDGGIPGLNTALDVPGPARALLSSYALDPELSFVERIKNFESNMVVEANYHYRRIGTGGASPDSQADPRSLPIKVVYNLYSLPQNNGYRPRLADPRVGYFVNGQLSADRAGFETFDETRADPRVVYINRWNLQKADPSAKLSPPVKPIVFFLDTSVPVKYRQTMREGILSWNRAFEALGFQNAVVVRDAPSGNSKDAQEYDHADMRFNTIRWVASPPTDSAYAVALMRENPLTGEIINASITVNANFARIGYRQKRDTVNPLGPTASGEGNTSSKFDARVHGAACTLVEQVADPRFTDEKYVNDLLRATVMHEFGHILGLRHNFIASTYESPESLANPAKVRRDGISASIMDYVGFNVFGLRTNADLFARNPGIYDRWAISYGYTPFSTTNEKLGLDKILARSGESGLAFSSDEQSNDYDPTVASYDLSSDPLAYTEKSFGVTRELLRKLPNQFPSPGENYATFTSRLRSLVVSSRLRDANIAARFVGGYRVRRVVRGSKNDNQPFSPAPLSQQRRALALLNREIFAPDAFNIPASYLTKTAPDPFEPSSPVVDAAFPFRDDISSARATLLVSLLSPDRLRRISNGEWKFPGQVLPMRELFTTLRQGVWGTPTPKTAFTALQRDLAANHLRLLVSFATDKHIGSPSDPAVPNDSRLIARDELRALKTALQGPRKGSPDAMSRLFFADSLRRIDAALQKKPE